MLTNFFYNLFVFITWLIPGHYAWISIVIITIILRLIFLKPTIDMTKMQHKQKGLQKHLSAIKEKHKDDKQAEQKATLELYKREGVNPLSSCLPMIVQLIVLIGFYQIFTRIGLGQIKTSVLYSFVPHLDTMNSTFFGLDLTPTVAQLFKSGTVGGKLALAFPILAAVTQLIQALQMKALQPKPDPNKKSDTFQTAMNSQFTYVFPLMTAYISYTLTTALSIYWITQTVLMIVQQKYVMSRLQPLEEDLKEGVAAVINQPQVSKKHGVLVEVRKKKD